MLIFRLKDSLISEDADAWKQLVTDSLGDTVHPNRAREFCLAREALRNCLKDVGYHLRIQDLILEGYDKVKQIDSLTISLSHCPGQGAALVASTRKYRSVGIDIEKLERIVKPAILAKVAHPFDVDLSPLFIWALKEAAFKAVMNTRQFERPIEFSSLKIGVDVWTHEDSGLQGGWELNQIEGHVLALAWIKI